MKSLGWIPQNLKESEIRSEIVISCQTSDQISFPEMVIAPEFAPWNSWGESFGAVFWHGCHTWWYQRKQPLGRKLSKSDATVKNPYHMYILDENWLTQTFVWMTWSNLFSISCSIKCRLDESIIFPCWWWVKAIYIFINYDYLSYQFCDSWTYPMFDTVRFRVSRTGPCPCPSISDNNYALIESNEKMKIFLYSWRREHHFQPFLWICPKSQGPLMF